MRPKIVNLLVAGIRESWRMGDSPVALLSRTQLCGFDPLREVDDGLSNVPDYFSEDSGQGFRPNTFKVADYSSSRARTDRPLAPS